MKDTNPKLLLTLVILFTGISTAHAANTYTRKESCSGTNTCLITTGTINATTTLPGSGPCIGSPVDFSLYGENSPFEIGDHTGDGISEVAIPYCGPSTISGKKVSYLSVVNVQANTILATSRSNYDNAATSFITRIKGPSGKLYPVHTSGYGDVPSGGNLLWGDLCIYKPGATNSSNCGANWMSVSVPLPTIGAGVSQIFREAGGYVYDFDNDGWEDINLIFHEFITTISGANGSSMSITSYNISQSTEPANGLFHSGRNYGIHVMKQDPTSSSTAYTAMIGGERIGLFNDSNCNVSHFIGVLKNVTTSGTMSRSLLWSKYYGFHSHIFDNVYVPIASTNITRVANFMNGCIHRPADGLTTQNNTPAIIFNHFKQSKGVENCIPEQFAFYDGTAASSNAWIACHEKNLKSRGVWHTNIFQMNNGKLLLNGSHLYTWGMGPTFLPAGKESYLVQVTPDDTYFDLTDISYTNMQIRTLNSRNAWQKVYKLPTQSIPVTVLTKTLEDKGSGSFTSIATIRTSDIDGDGLLEILFKDNRWIGYSSASDSFVVKGTNGSIVNPTLVTTPVSCALYATKETMTIGQTSRIIHNSYNATSMKRGSAVVSLNGAYNFTPTASGLYSFTYTATGASGATATCTKDILVH